MCFLCNSKQNLPLSKGGDLHPTWKGGRRVLNTGYIEIWIPKTDKFYEMSYKGYILEHRYLMAKKLNRLLHSWEHVDHKNNIKDDNNLNNLQLLDNKYHSQITKMRARIKELEDKFDNY